MDVYQRKELTVIKVVDFLGGQRPFQAAARALEVDTENFSFWVLTLNVP